MSRPAAPESSGSFRETPGITIAPDSNRLADAVASALIARLAAVQAVHRSASLVLTGGGIGTAVLARVAELTAAPSSDVVDWRAVQAWWSDERFIPAGDPRRNEVAARRALLDPLAVPADQVHPMPASDSEFAAAQDAALWYADQLAAAAPSGRALPRFDVLLLGMGADGHVASIFPQSPATRDTRPVFAVRNCPKPPPTRLSLGFSAINTAAEVWLLVSGRAKAPAVACALSRADPVQIPASGVHGSRATRWWLDAAAASNLSPVRSDT